MLVTDACSQIGTLQRDQTESNRESLSVVYGSMQIKIHFRNFVFRGEFSIFKNNVCCCCCFPSVKELDLYRGYICNIQC